MSYKIMIGGQTFAFADLKTLLAKATPLRSGDILAGVAATSAQERVAAQQTLANVRLSDFFNECLVDYDTDEVTRLIFDTHDKNAFEPIKHLTVGGLRDWLLSDKASSLTLQALAPGLIPEIAAAVVKIMRLQDLISVGRKCRVVTKFRNTIGLENCLSTRVQPNHPSDDPKGVAASLFDGLLLGGGDAVIGINPATDSVDACVKLLDMLDSLRTRFEMPTQSCVLTHVTNSIQAMQRGAPLDLVFQSVAGTQEANRSFGIDLELLREAHEMALSLKRGTVGDNVMYFETGQGSALSANAHHGMDQQTVEARAYAVARAFSPLLVNTVVGFIGPEYLYDGKQIIRAGLEDHCCGKLLGLPMGCDVCYTNHAEADQDDMDALLTLLGAAGCTFIMGIPGSDDIMLNYQSTSFHDALYVREVLGKRPAPEFEAWLEKIGIVDKNEPNHPLLARSTGSPQLTKLLGNMNLDLTPNGSQLAVQSSVWTKLREFTPARIGIEPVGVSQPTESVLKFAWDHALARDAVHSPLDVPLLERHISALGLKTVAVHSDATSRAEYLQRPDKGRRLNRMSIDLLKNCTKGWDIVFVLADGLSSLAVQENASRTFAAVLTRLASDEFKIGPAVVAEQARVAIGDEIGSLLDAELVVVLIGERPGLSAANSLGVYITWNPRVGTVDSERNCISNIRQGGLSYETAATKLVYLIRSARLLKLTGIDLKDEAVLECTEPVASLT